jgi:hypothetical protein
MLEIANKPHRGGPGNSAPMGLSPKYPIFDPSLKPGAIGQPSLWDEWK